MLRIPGCSASFGNPEYAARVGNPGPTSRLNTIAQLEYTRDVAAPGSPPRSKAGSTGLSRDFIYLPERGRNVMVDSRAILESLDDIYQADRIVAELLAGRLRVPAAEAERLRP